MNAIERHHIVEMILLIKSKLWCEIDNFLLLENRISDYVKFLSLKGSGEIEGEKKLGRQEKDQSLGLPHFWTRTHIRIRCRLG